MLQFLPNASRVGLRSCWAASLYWLQKGGASVEFRSSAGLDGRALRRSFAAAVGRRRLLFDRRNEFADARRDFLAEAGAVEHAVVADFQLQVMLLPRRGNVDAKLLRRLGLTRAGNIVLLAFDGHQAAIADRSRIDALPAMHHLALRQRMADEHRLDRLHVIGRV